MHGPAHDFGQNACQVLWRSARRRGGSSELVMLATALLALFAVGMAEAQVAVRGDKIYTMAGREIENGVVICREGKIAAIGRADAIEIDDEMKLLDAEIVTPGLIDAHSTVGLSGIYNYDHDQDQLESSSPIQPELRAMDAYNAQEPLIDWIRGFGVTTIHTAHAPGELISGQSMVVKTAGNTVEDAMLVKTRAVAATLGSGALKRGQSSPGTRGKMVSMLRALLIKTREHVRKHDAGADDEEKDDEEKDEEKDEEENDPPPRDLRMEIMAQVLNKELPLMVTAQRAQDIANALRLAEEFDLDIWLDGGAEAYLMIDQIKAAGVPVIVHPLMARPGGEMQNLSFQTPARLIDAGIPVYFQSGFESYVPKTRVVLLEAAIAAGHGVSFEQTLSRITIESARLLGVDDQVGSLEVGKDADLALFDGDPFEYTTHCTGVVIDGEVVEDESR